MSVEYGFGHSALHLIVLSHSVCVIKQPHVSPVRWMSLQRAFIACIDSMAQSELILMHRLALDYRLINTI